MYTPDNVYIMLNITFSYSIYFLGKKTVFIKFFFFFFLLFSLLPPWRIFQVFQNVIPKNLLHIQKVLSSYYILISKQYIVKRYKKICLL